MTPDHISSLWDLDSHQSHLLVKDFIDGTYFCLADLYSIHTFSDYADASNTFFKQYKTLDEASTIGKSLPAYHTFKSIYPEYFL